MLVPCHINACVARTMLVVGVCVAMIGNISADTDGIDSKPSKDAHPSQANCGANHRSKQLHR